ncbi:MAG: phosphatidylglycerophosphatase A [Prosthecochloris sp.]|uniref:phosphatidylglycerophosphatase A family protein n=1 Tax=Prosthecochloris sp. TaxID=290513 RepID=UPI00258DFCB5|nr:phosphatidylglycerophosphatase A [Prosthecochloris sp.]MCW8798496.1 phosphatidylglycerophosphatase A [Prosthecochloris sp.]
MSAQRSPFAVKLFMARFFGSCGGLGFFPVAPGTVTSFVAAAVYFLLPSLATAEVLIPLIVVAFLVGLMVSPVMESLYGHDPSQVTIDEVAGQWVAFLFLPHTWVTVVLGFAAFRFFDIVKPEPVNSAQRLAGGWGIMTDDILAGIYANLSVRIIVWALSFTALELPL